MLGGPSLSYREYPQVVVQPEAPDVRGPPLEQHNNDAVNCSSNYTAEYLRLHISHMNLLLYYICTLVISWTTMGPPTLSHQGSIAVYLLLLLSLETASSSSSHISQRNLLAMALTGTG